MLWREISVESGLLRIAMAWLGLYLFTLPCASPCAAAAQMAEVPAPVAKVLRTQKIRLADVSFYVHNTGESQPRLAINARQPRNPASTIKLLTTKAGLDILGPGFVWKTKAYAAGPVRDGRLQGDLILKGHGDPAMTPETLWRLLWGVRERGIETISGNILLDGSYFEPPEAARGDFDGNATSSYNALPHALSVNFQTTRVHLVGDGSGKGVRVFTDPPLANLEVQNNLRLVKAPCKRKFHKPALTLYEKGNIATLRLTGTFASSCGEASYPRLVLDPAEHTAGAVLALWEGMQGGLDGHVLEGAVPERARLLYTLESRPLEEAVRQINKWSNNLMSRTLFLTLGARQKGAPGSLTKARQAVSDWLSDQDLDFPELVLENGSGLSRVTRISAESMGRLLGYAYAGATMPEFLSSLSIAGVDGTMRKRFKKSALKGQAHIKTGTIRGATGIAGYVLDQEGERWIVVSLINNPRLQAWRGKAVENALLQWVFEKAGAGGQVSAESSAGPSKWFRRTAHLGP
jgi:D-alanyl-D-alanine carboxypeptidase/D-alanyl-D-alanine-endopeptidase (penicillin-binding protein 4)